MRNELRTADPFSSHDDPEVVQVLEYYLSELEADRLPDRATLLAEHPEIAGPLAECLDGLDFLRKAVALDESKTPWPTPDGKLGDYRLLRTIGRGGMGTVYEAEDTNTGDRVAVKVLNPVAGMNALDRRRFQHEIQAATSLSHPNIVPILSVGSDRGVQFFAMRQIAGHSLSELVARPSGIGKTTLRDQLTIPQGQSRDRSTALNPTLFPLPHDPKELAGLMLQAAEALGYAHSLGIIHRDVKPANLLLDGEGHLWVADFGLAFVPGLSRLTHSSALVGTLRYMSPEQVEPRRGVVDQRADLYGLGATFYELLTGRPVFADADRGVLIQRILHEEPTPPRKCNPEIPYALETILLKLLAKEPARRYSSMADLVDDLQRYRADRSILARRPSLWDRSLVWLDRNRRLAKFGLFALVGFSVLIGWNQHRIARERNQKAVIARETDTVVDFMYTRYAEMELAREPHQELLHRELLLRALQHYQSRASSSSATTDDRIFAAIAWRRVADISQRLGISDDSRRSYDEAVSRLQQLHSELPTSHKVQRELAIARNDLGNLHRANGDMTKAEGEYERAAALFAKAMEAAPGELFDRVGLAGVESNRGLLLQSQHRMSEAKLCFESARSQYARLAMEFPDRREFLSDAASSSHNLAVLLASSGRDSEAEPIYRDAMILREDLLLRDPGSPVFRREAARTRMQFAELLLRVGKRDEATATASQAMQGWRQLALDFPQVPSYRVGLAASSKMFALAVGTPK